MHAPVKKKIISTTYIRFRFDVCPKSEVNLLNNCKRAVLKMAHMLNVPWTSFPAGWSLVGSEALRLPQEPQRNIYIIYIIFKGKEMDA